MMETSYASSGLAVRALRVPPRQLVLQRTIGSTGAFFERAATFILLFLLSDAVVPHLVGAGATGAAAVDGNPTLRLVTAGVSATCLMLCAVHWRDLRAAMRRNVPLVLLIVLACLSFAWSAQPDLTLRRSMVVFATSAFGLMLAARWSPASLVRLVAGVLGVAAALSVVFALVVPSYGIDRGIHAGAWQGVFTQKNTLGIMMTVAALAFMIRIGQKEGSRALNYFGFAVATALLLLSTSKTALVALITILALLPLFRLLRVRHNAAVPMLIFAALAVGLIATVGAVNREAVLNALGRDPTLTGRTELWQGVIAAGAPHAWLGQGYAAFWSGLESPAVSVWERVGWTAPNAHNGYLDLWLDLGLVGVALFLIAAVIAWVRGVRLVHADHTTAALWPLAFVTLFLLYNASEGMILSGTNLLWVLFVASAASPAIHATDPRTGGAFHVRGGGAR